MELLRVTGLSYHLAGRTLLQQVSLTVQPKQKIGLVGRNGIGKSTLLALLGGERQPDEGSFWRAPGLRVERLEQATRLPPQGTVWEYASASLHHLRTLEQMLRQQEQRLTEAGGQVDAQLERYGDLLELFEQAGGYDAPERLERTLTALGFGEERWAQPVATLSGGERARLSLIRALAPGADLLLLDEPSTHLDIRTSTWLADTLSAYPGALIVASHDRALLDAVTTHTLHLQQGSLTLHRGSYSVFRQRQDTLRLKRERDARETDKNRRQLQDSMNRLQGWGTPTAARQRKSIAKRLERLERPPTATRERDDAIVLDTRSGRGLLLEAQHLSITLDGQPVVFDANLRIEAGDKIALVGPNGTGKSTFLKLLSGKLESEHPQTSFCWGQNTKIAIFDQAGHGLDPDEPLLAQLERFVSPERGKMLLALVGLPQETWLGHPHELSGGQQARAGIARLMASEANLLLLDEPTEHLDIELIETLETALEDTRAAVLLVSHDQALVRQVATRVLTLEQGRLKEYRGGLDGYFSGTLRREEDTTSPLPGNRPEGAQAQSAADERDALELERLELEERLSDPFRLTERELERYTERYREVLGALSVLYDAALPPPAPALAAREGEITVTGDRHEGTTYVFNSDTGVGAKLFVSPTERVAHLALLEPSDTCVLAWARTRVVQALVRLVFERVGMRALQLQSDHDLSNTDLRPTGSNWWVLSREQYEQANGYTAFPRVPRGRRRRRKRKPARD